MANIELHGIDYLADKIICRESTDGTWWVASKAHDWQPDRVASNYFDDLRCSGRSLFMAPPEGMKRIFDSRDELIRAVKEDMNRFNERTKHLLGPAP